MSNFDPSKAEIGVHNRSAFIPSPKNRVGGEFVAVEEEEVGSDFAGSRHEAMKVGAITAEDVNLEELAELDKEAGAPSTHMPPDDVAHPMFPEPGSDPGSDSPSPPTDLKPHGSHEAPKPDPSKLIRERIRNLRVHEDGGHKEEIEEHLEQQNSQREANQARGTDITVNRRDMDISRTGSNIANKTASLDDEFEDDDLNPIRLYLILEQKWDEEWRDWEPETIIATLRKDGITISRTNMDKVMALKVLLNTEEFWNDTRTFEKVCLAFANRMVDWGRVQEPRVHEIAACIALIERYISEKEYSDDIAVYVAGSAVRDGYIMLPPQLSFANFEFANELAVTMGDEVLELQQKLMDAMEDETKIPKDHGVQYLRILRCQYHVQDMIDGAKG